MGNNKKRTGWFPPFIDGVGLKPQETATEIKVFKVLKGAKQGMKCITNRHLWVNMFSINF